jgi:endoglucanase
MSRTKIALLVVLTVGSATACAGSEPVSARPGFVHVAGDSVVDTSGAPFALEGITFGSFYYGGKPGGGEERAAYAEVAEMGLNYVRFYVDAATLQGDSEPGSYDPEALAVLDENIAFAGENGLHVVLALNAPPGGSDFDCGNDAFWDSADDQDQMVELWRMLAARYADEPVIAGYSLLDPANPSRSLEQWQELADRTTRAIRAIDSKHILFVANANSIHCVYDLGPSKTFVRVDDANVVYDFGHAEPWAYVAQLTQPAGDPNGVTLPEYGPYPDETRSATGPDWLYTPQDTRPSAKQLNLTPEETDWTQKVFYYTVTEPRFLYAIPVLQADDTSGKAYFDDILIEEVGSNGDTRVIERIDVESPDGWYFWEGNSTAEIKGTGVVTTEDTGHESETSVAISGTTGYANLAGQDWSRFLVQVGSTYRVTSWVKGADIAPRDRARVRLDFYGYREPVTGFNRKTLEDLFTDFAAWGRAQGVPLSVTAFGTARPSFDRGGLIWVSDMIDIMRERHLNWAYWGYRDKDYGIYTNLTGAPDPTTENRPLVELLTQKRHQ